MGIPDWEWQGFPAVARTREEQAREAWKARENSPERVLGQMGFILASALSVALGTNLLLLALHIG
jgi:hypothetical protein